MRPSRAGSSSTVETPKQIIIFYDGDALCWMCNFVPSEFGFDIIDSGFVMDTVYGQTGTRQGSRDPGAEIYLAEKSDDEGDYTGLESNHTISP